MLQSQFTESLIEAGCDEAGRGCLAGPVFAAAVILPKGFRHEWLNDSKQLSEKQREQLRPVIEAESVCWAVSKVEAEEIDRINILNASIKAMHQAIAQLTPVPELLLIDGNRFKPVLGIVHQCVIRGDSIFMSIAAASILAKTYRDDFMVGLHEQFPHYNWKSNKGYPTIQHRRAIGQHGISPFHRKSYQFEIPETTVINNQGKLV
jgi:ribonuclease HII